MVELSVDVLAVRESELTGYPLGTFKIWLMIIPHPEFHTQRFHPLAHCPKTLPTKVR